MSAQDQLPDRIAENVRKLANYTDGEYSAEQITDALQTKREESGGTWSTAFKLVKKDLVDASSSGGSSGRGNTASIITIGFDRVARWPDRDHDDFTEGMDKDAMPRKDVLIANGIVRNEETGKTDIGVIIFDSNNGVNIGKAMELFSEPLNVVSGRFNFTEPRISSRGNVLFSNSDTTIQQIDDPMPLEERQQLLDKFVDDVDVASIANDPHSNLSLAGSQGPADFGIDIKRIPGAVIYGNWINDEEDRGVYTILDDSVMGPEELEGTPVNNDKQRVPGLSGWGHSDLMKYDNDTIADFYGVIKEDWNGQIVMDVRGINPEHATFLDEDNDLGSQTSESF